MNRPPSPGTERLPPKKREPRERPAEASSTDHCFKVPAPYSAPIRGKSSRQPDSYAEYLPLAPPLTPTNFPVPWYMSCPMMAPNPFPFDQDGLSSWREQNSGTRHPIHPRQPQSRWPHAPAARPLTGSASHGMEYPFSDPFAHSDHRVTSPLRVLPLNSEKYFSEWRPNGFPWREAWSEVNQPCKAGQLGSLANSERALLISQGGPAQDCPTASLQDSSSLQHDKDPQVQFSTASLRREPSTAEDNHNSRRLVHVSQKPPQKAAEPSPQVITPHRLAGLSPAIHSRDLQDERLQLARAGDGQETKQWCKPRDASGELHLSKAPSPFAGGSLVELSGGRLKRVEELQTEDFLLSGSPRPGLCLSSCTVLGISPSVTPGYMHLQVHLTDHLTQELLEVLLEYPFFVCERGWSSCDPQKTACLYGLRCRQLAIGDVCFALTPAPTKTPPSAEPTKSPPSPDTCAAQPRKRHWSAPDVFGEDRSLVGSPQNSKHRKKQ
ncbi:uncharacterized protein [Paramormyrops kingsleyae]|uniref:uncharacterized protein n=1 Tax=Paramormyrops kingsleyae TaxID=1676925 RepID=UPI000CD63682|nr:uncharacterized protein LOC111857229 [Paramormyrops kingsleyae]XP_023693626.1 uncharacterized protein LOC111857229 [Paramormyrops kingsleyae]XP_023693627.1 uncharacterized protein LOC111857229 [Paramormyrops kingsleyae]XP_023693628.1 uncharacterized protein LOC111857229 [Paramormyrops kingsleyae]XP_023693629.1 uncharacterized protein LOC111857229 [Paramormyrops kingsleyae]